MNKIPEDSNSTVPAVDRALSIFEYLLTNGRSTVKDLSTVCQIPPASASRLLKTLVQRGYISEHKDAGNFYTLGLKLLQFSQAVFNDLDIDLIAKNVMKDLSNKTGQASQLAILDNDTVMYTQVAFPKSPISIIAPLRTPIPINLSAGGKAICAFLPEFDRVELVKKANLVKATKNSVTDKLAFLQMLSQVHKYGYATDLQEFSEAIGCVAAPIFDHTGKVIAAIGITGQYSLYKEIASFERLKNEVILSAQTISRQIGFN